MLYTALANPLQHRVAVGTRDTFETPGPYTAARPRNL